MVDVSGSPTWFTPLTLSTEYAAREVRRLVEFVLRPAHPSDEFDALVDMRFRLQAIDRVPRLGRMGIDALAEIKRYGPTDLIRDRAEQVLHLTQPGWDVEAPLASMISP